MIVAQAPRIGITLSNIAHKNCGSGFVDKNQPIKTFNITPTTKPSRNAINNLTIQEELYHISKQLRLSRTDNLRTLILDNVAQHKIARDIVLVGRELRQEIPK